MRRVCMEGPWRRQRDGSVWTGPLHPPLAVDAKTPARCRGADFIVFYTMCPVFEGITPLTEETVMGRSMCVARYRLTEGRAMAAEDGHVIASGWAARSSELLRPITWRLDRPFTGAYSPVPIRSASSSTSAESRPVPKNESVSFRERLSFGLDEGFQCRTRAHSNRHRAATTARPIAIGKMTPIA